MKAERVKMQWNTGNYGEDVFACGGKASGKAQMSTERSFCQRITEGGLEEGLANLWSRKRITKKAYAGRGQETQWEIPVQTDGLEAASFKLESRTQNLCALVS
jgi:hypothetical protein